MNWLKNSSLRQNIVIKDKSVFPLALFPCCIFYAITFCLRAITAGFAGPKTCFFENMPLYLFLSVQRDKVKCICLILLLPNICSRQSALNAPAAVNIKSSSMRY